MALRARSPEARYQLRSIATPWLTSTYDQTPRSALVARDHERALHAAGARAERLYAPQHELAVVSRASLAGSPSPGAGSAPHTPSSSSPSATCAELAQRAARSSASSARRSTPLRCPSRIRAVEASAPATSAHERDLASRRSQRSRSAGELGHARARQRLEVLARKTWARVEPVARRDLRERCPSDSSADAREYANALAAPPEPARACSMPAVRAGRDPSPAGARSPAAQRGSGRPAARARRGEQRPSSSTVFCAVRAQRARPERVVHQHHAAAGEVAGAPGKHRRGRVAAPVVRVDRPADQRQAVTRGNASVAAVRRPTACASASVARRSPASAASAVHVSRSISRSLSSVWRTWRWQCNCTSWPASRTARAERRRRPHALAEHEERRVARLRRRSALSDAGRLDRSSGPSSKVRLSVPAHGRALLCASASLAPKSERPAATVMRHRAAGETLQAALTAMSERDGETATFRLRAPRGSPGGGVAAASNTSTRPASGSMIRR